MEVSEISKENEAIQKRYEAILYLDFNRPIEAMKLFKECIALDSTNETYNELGLIFHSRFANYAEAIAHYSKALEYDEKAFFIYYQLGKALVCIHDVENATNAYIKAIEYGEDPYFIVQSYLALIEIYTQSESSDETIDSLYEKAFKSMESYFLPYYHRAVWLFSKQRYREALHCANKALEYNSYFVKTYYLISSIYTRMEYWDEAIYYAKEAVFYSEEHPLYIAWYTRIVEVYKQYLEYTRNTHTMPNFLKALEGIEGYNTIERIIQEYEEYSSIMQSYTQQKELYIAKAYVLLHKKSYQEALEAIMLAYMRTNDKEEQIALQCMQASVYEAMYAYEDVATCYVHCYHTASEDKKALYAYNAGCAYRSATLLEDAVLWLYHAYSAEPYSTLFLYEYSIALFAQGNIKEGLESLAILRTLPIKNDSIFQHCIELLYKNNAYRECIRWCELWKQYNPSNYIAYFYCASSRYARQYLHDALENATNACLLSPSNDACKALLVTVEDAVACFSKENQVYEQEERCAIK